MYCPPKTILPKGTLAPNSGNISTNVRIAQVLKNGQSGIYKKK